VGLWSPRSHAHSFYSTQCRYKVTVDPLSEGEVLCSHHATLISVMYASRNDRTTILRQQWISDEELLSHNQLILSPTEPLTNNRAMVTPLRETTKQILASEELWHEIHIAKGEQPRVIHHKVGHSPSPRTSTPGKTFFDSQSSPDTNSPVRDAGGNGAALLERARRLCEHDGTSTGDWSLVGVAPDMAEIRASLSNEFGRAAYLRHEVDVKGVIAAATAKRDPAAAAERERCRQRRVLVKMATWVDAHAVANAIPEKVREIEAALKERPPLVAAAALDFDFGAMRKLMEEELAEEEIFRGMEATRRAELGVAMRASDDRRASREAEEAASAAEAAAATAAAAVEDERAARVEALKEKQRRLAAEERGRREAEETRRVDAEAARVRAAQDERDVEAARLQAIVDAERAAEREAERVREAAQRAREQSIARQRQMEERARQHQADAEFARKLQEQDEADRVQREKDRFEQQRQSAVVAERLRREEQLRREREEQNRADEAAARRIHEDQIRQQQQIDDRKMAQQLSHGWNAQ
jgi:hypothetical protein